jgi:predicted nucleic acid-binding protein
LKVFFDTNVLVYTFDRDSPAKRHTAAGLVEDHRRAGEILLGTRVLHEFYVTITRKLARSVSGPIAHRAVEALMHLPIVRVDPLMILSAIGRSQSAALSVWHALVVKAALEGGATTLLSEDLQHGQQFDGLTVVNPFLSPSSTINTAAGSRTPRRTARTAWCVPPASR